MKDYTHRDVQHFTEKLWASVGIPQRYLDATKNADMLEILAKRRKRLTGIRALWNFDANF